VSVFVANKTEPYIFSGKYQPMGEFGETYWYKSFLMTRKFKGKETATYTSKGEAVVIAKDKVPKKIVTRELIKQAEKIVKRGRYYDWTWQDRPTGTVAIFAPPPLVAPSKKGSSNG
jgi:hypothetical protein